MYTRQSMNRNSLCMHEALTWHELVNWSRTKGLLFHSLFFMVVDFFIYILLFILFKILVQICKIMYYI
jgi:hypothetical protein